MGDFHQIEIRRLRVVARVGVPDEELAVPQELRVSAVITVATPFAEMADDLEKTLDYAALATGIQALAASRPRRLIETLASDIASHVLSFPVVDEVEVTVEKFILPDTDCVAVRIRRGKPSI
jgi:7,8-dihydroneopterin aldolase/epimerase/oxygenase